MSHFTEIKTQIKDIEALRLACRELGLSLVPNTEAKCSSSVLGSIPSDIPFASFKIHSLSGIRILL